MAPSFRLFLPGMLMVASGVHSAAQTVPAPAAAPLPPAAASPVPAESAPDKLLLKVGLNAGRALGWGGYEGFLGRVPLSVGAEVALSPRFTLYGQADADFSLHRRAGSSGERGPLVSTGAVGLGGRYYYNQAGRARHNRAHGQFIGNYLGLEARTELNRRFDWSTRSSPSLNLIWGMQRRINRGLLFDLNAGVGVGPNQNSAVPGPRPERLTLTTQLNASLYFGR